MRQTLFFFRNRLLCGNERDFQLFGLHPLFIIRHAKQWRVILSPLNPRTRFHGVVIEECEELIKLLLRDGIVFVIVATAASHRQTKPYRRCCFNPVDDGFHAPFLGNNAPFSVDPMIAIEAGRDLLIHRRIRQQIPRQLIDRKLIERLIPIERRDDPIAPSPHETLEIRLIPIAIRISRAIQPLHRHPFPIARRRQQSIDYFLIRIRGTIFHESFDFFG